MHPLFAIGAAAAGLYAITKKAAPAPAPAAVAPAVTKAAADLARSRMARGASAEEAAQWAADKISQRGGDLMDSRRQRRSEATIRF